MLVRPRFADHRVIGFYTGKIIVGIGLLMIVPLTVALVSQEWNTALDFAVGMSSCFLFGFATYLLFRTGRDLSWGQGMVVASGSWLLAMLFGAIPHYLSGHFGSYLDASFDLMSGYTTTGLFLLQDLDHVSNGLNMWRHLLTYAGGQGIIVVALTFMIRGTAGAFKMYVGEGKDEKLMPNVVQTARAIWLLSLAYLVTGSLALWAVGLYEGMPPVRGLLHAVWVFMGAWSTGGFAPQSMNVGYYHSFPYEFVTIIIFIIGSFNFALHWAVWTGNRREIFRNIETQSFTITLLGTTALATIGMVKLGVYPDTMAFIRKAFYQVASGHTTTGFGTVYAREFVTQWGLVGMLGTIIAMAFGASAASTGGGFKALRIGITWKGFMQNVREIVSPESAVITQKFHHIRDTVLEDSHVRAAMLIILAYVFIYTFGGVLGAYYGHPLTQGLFDSVSAGSNTGLSCGVTAPAMPWVMKVYYIFAMWAGRLEFMSIFALVGVAVAIVRGR